MEPGFFPAGDVRPIAVINAGRPGPGAWRTRNPRLDAGQVITAV
ncbi:hypothetical protein [Actinomadura darangshiensis]|nr:hypothetical protein [Actinomadura darangshiensis]